MKPVTYSVYGIYRYNEYKIVALMFGFFNIAGGIK